MFAQWTPPIALPPSTAPAPGSGYESDDWWREPLGEFFEAATEQVREAIGYEPEPDALALEQVRQASIVPPASRTGALVIGAVAIGALLFFGRRSPRRR